MRHPLLETVTCAFFKAAAKVAKGEMRHQRINGKIVRISLRQRRRWISVAKHIALTMNNIVPNFDEQEIHAQLNELERLVNEANTVDQPRNEKITRNLQIEPRNRIS
jgi:hypothetical protein